MKKVFFKNKDLLINLIIENGYTLNSLSIGIGKCRQYLGQALKKECIGAKAAKDISEALDAEYREIFEIR